MMFWRSVVFKLWFTFLLLISIVLFILTVMLLEYFQQYHSDQTKKGLENTATKIASILSKHKAEAGVEIAWDLLDDEMGATIIQSSDKVILSPKGQVTKLSPHYLAQNKKLSDAISKGKTKVITIKDPINDQDQLVIVGTPLIESGKSSGAVYIYQSLKALNETKNSTTKFIVLAAVIAIVLTTIFAFFLLTRITAPLRKMREAAFELAKGNFDTKVPIMAQDEIGELAIAFNNMAKRLNFNINALSEEKEQLGNILSGMADGVITFNKNGRLLITNPPAERFLQHWHYEQNDYTKEGQVPTKVNELFLLAVTTGEEQIDEIKLQGRYWVVIVSPLYNKDFIRGAIAVIRDMTEERKLDKLRIDFIANVSHELRTPISMLQGYSEAIVDDIAGSEAEKKEMAQIIYDESVRMGKLVNELLDLARMEAEHVDLLKEEVEISSFLQKVSRKFNALAKEKDISLIVHSPSIAQAFYMDPDRIEQVLTNVIDNCIRHTPLKGKVTIDCKVDSSGVTWTIEDTGIGISEEDLPFVFERFYKADKARTRGNSGTGLGLAIAKNIVEAHHGHISVHSKVGSGTTFLIYLPRILE
ncbi:ATP-binding protein [Niallia sp. NCCP-28]|uniref:ATP-binding protein n=1 Tax=Niallia sp. NCCP-28 TaxID=2934712 RepID=UPI00207EC208|nr:ATP-binding protein [Niallia sp. NCCP-28]GKU81051.1 sensor histidine kinase ResE [Niallia sp. NCCP-28]